jgi:hypothetical protein
MEYIESVDREQMIMTSLDQLVHPESFVRIIDALVVVWISVFILL